MVRYISARRPEPEPVRAARLPLGVRGHVPDDRVRIAALGV